jgi:hypothetical protein
MWYLSLTEVTIGVSWGMQGEASAPRIYFLPKSRFLSNKKYKFFYQIILVVFRLFWWFKDKEN